MSDTGLSFTASAFKHGVDRETIASIIADLLFMKYHSSHTAIILYGFASDGKMIEVAYDFQTRTAFHAMPVKPSKKGINDGI
ncbi:MAG: hypothetical protein LBL86_04985 [Coriobacteriales bacterium]|jgi:hypothetical protein|nr:hypothetical protein [Coriobacteriales bacterium]